MRRLIILCALILILIYGLFEARRLIEGPQITIDSPQDGSATSSTAVVISGTAENIAFLTIDDKPAYTDEQGQFTDLLSLHPGVTILTVKATDRFGRSAEKSVSIQVLNYCSINDVS
jgi:hypothetical protein